MTRSCSTWSFGECKTWKSSSLSLWRTKSRIWTCFMTCPDSPDVSQEKKCLHMQLGLRYSISFPLPGKSPLKISQDDLLDPMAFRKWNGWLRDLDLGWELWASVALMWEPLSCKRDIPNFLGSGRHLYRGRQSLTPESLLYQQHYHNQHLQGGGFRVMSFLDYQIVTHHERIFWFQHQPWFYDFRPCFECAESWWWATWDAVCDERWKTQRKRSMEFAASGCAFNHTGSGARRVWKTGKKISVTW